MNWGIGFSEGDWVVVKVNQKEVARLSLETDQITHVKGPLGLTEVEVKKGQARIVRSPCKNKVCIKSGYIRYADRLAVCIPNRVVVRIVGESHRGVDAVVGWPVAMREKTVQNKELKIKNFFNGY